MGANTILRLGLLGAAFGGWASAWAGITNPGTIPAQEKARDLLKRVMTGGYRVPFDAIVMQRSGCTEELMCQFKLEQDRSGRRRMVGLGPLAIQGVVSFDDGERWINYFPDENRMVVMGSPRADREDVDARLRLAGQNYRFAIETGGRVAGRSAVIVVAIPRHSGMPGRRYAIDARTDVLLRVETVGAEPAVMFDTRAIRFSEGMIVEPPAAPDVPLRVVRPAPPVRVSRLSDVRAIAGFQPLAPRQFSHGFVLREIQVGGTGTQRYAAIRLSDGLCTATMYQWPASAQPLGPDRVGLDFAHGGVVCRLTGDLPFEQQYRFMQAFAREFGRALPPVREPNPGDGRFLPKREHELAHAAERTAVQKSVAAAGETLDVPNRL